MKFQWDSGIIKHIIKDYPQWGNTLDEVESIFSDANLSILPGRASLND